MSSKNFIVATEVRKEVLGLIHRAGTSHIGSNFSCIDILTVLFEQVIKNLDKDLRPDRDRIITSKGWCAAAMYVFLRRKGVLSESDLDTFGKPDGLLGLVERTTRGIEASCGSMGHGLPIGVGMALGAKRNGEKWHTYVLMSDGEQVIGTTWESALIAAHHHLDNLTVIIDYNKICAMGNTNEILNLESLEEKWKAFGFEVCRINGHDFEAIYKALMTQTSGRPLVVIADTVKGKGVSFFENKLEWHYKAVLDEHYAAALKELV